MANAKYFRNYWRNRLPAGRSKRNSKSRSSSRKTSGYGNIDWIYPVPTGSNAPTDRRRISIPLTGNPRSHSGAKTKIHRKERLGQLETFLRNHPKLAKGGLKTLDYVWDHGGRAVSRFYLQRLAHLEKIYKRLTNNY